MTEIILDYHEIRRIATYIEISSRKNDPTLEKIRSVIKHLHSAKYPICKITVEEKCP